MKVEIRLSPFDDFPKIFSFGVIGINRGVITYSSYPHAARV